MHKKKFILGNINKPTGARGWLLGAFLDKNHSLYREDLEIGYMKLTPETKDKKHYHEKCDEYIIVIKGEMWQEVDGGLVKLKQGDFIYQPAGCVTELIKVPEYAEIVIIKTPSIPTDKIYV